MSAARRPDREAIPPVQRLRIRYTKTGRMRFTSHRDFQRALERAVRRARVPMAYSAGFSPHPRISYANAAPTGAASLAEYVEIAVVERCDPQALGEQVDAALPTGLDIAEVVTAATPDLVARLQASAWAIEFPAAARADIDPLWQALLAATEIPVTRMTKSGNRTFDVRSAVVSGEVVDGELAAGDGSDPVLQVTLRHQVPSVRPDDVVSALAQLGPWRPPAPPILTRLAQGPLHPDGSLGDPLAPDRVAGEQP